MTLYQYWSNRSAPLNKMAARAKNRKPLNDFFSWTRRWIFEIIVQEYFLGDPLLKLLKRFRYIEQDGRQGYK